MLQECLPLLQLLHMPNFLSWNEIWHGMLWGCFLWQTLGPGIPPGCCSLPRVLCLGVMMCFLVICGFRQQQSWACNSGTDTHRTQAWTASQTAKGKVLPLTAPIQTWPGLIKHTHTGIYRQRDGQALFLFSSCLGLKVRLRSMHTFAGSSCTGQGLSLPPGQPCLDPRWSDSSHGFLTYQLVQHEVCWWIKHTHSHAYQVWGRCKDSGSF